MHITPYHALVRVQGKASTIPVWLSFGLSFHSVGKWANGPVSVCPSGSVFLFSVPLKKRRGNNKKKLLPDPPHHHQTSQYGNGKYFQLIVRKKNNKAQRSEKLAENKLVLFRRKKKSKSKRLALSDIFAPVGDRENRITGFAASHSG